MQVLSIKELQREKIEIMWDPHVEISNIKVKNQGKSKNSLSVYNESKIILCGHCKFGGKFKKSVLLHIFVCA